MTDEKTEQCAICGNESEPNTFWRLKLHDGFYHFCSDCFRSLHDEYQGFAEFLGYKIENMT